jgi:aspartate aminotransferase-like enzyme
VRHHGQRRNLVFKIASTAEEFDAIHRLNHATFAVEIPQHAASPDGRLIDRYHRENTYAVCLGEGAVVGMVSGRCARPFSLDHKLSELDSHLPPHRRAVEIRLLAVAAGYRHSAVFAGLVRLIMQHFLHEGCDLAVISGTVRQAKLYRHLGFRPFAMPVGTAQALYQPMLLTLEALHEGPLLRTSQSAASQSAPDTAANFLPGPVALRSDVLAAAGAAPISHRDVLFLEQLARVRGALASLVCARHALLLVGTGTLGNDAVAAQLRCLEGPGLVLSNGEFGERLADHAVRWNLSFSHVRQEWGRAYDWRQLEVLVARSRPRWVWSVLCETSTGVLNCKKRLLALAESVGADLCLDAVSAVGLFPVNLEGVRFATAASGKGLAALPGLVAVLHDGRIAPEGSVPRYLDLAMYEAASGVPFTHSSNLLGALDHSLAGTRWQEKFQRVERASVDLRKHLRELGLTLAAADADAAPGILTIALPAGVDSECLARTLSEVGIQIAWASGYLRERNWVQMCLMGEFDEAVALRGARRLAGEVVRATAAGAAAGGAAAASPATSWAALPPPR